MVKEMNEQLLVADLESHAAVGLDVKPADPGAAPSGAGSQSAIEAERHVVLRRLEELKAEQATLDRVLKLKYGQGGSTLPIPDPSPEPRFAQVTHKHKITPPKEWDGDFDRAKRETWIRSARGYLNGIGIADADLLDESRDALPIHTVRMLFSAKDTHGFSPQAWFNARHEREPFTTVAAVFAAVREYWTDDQAADSAYDKYRAARQGTLRAREFGAQVEVLANDCFDRTIDEADRIATFERGLTDKYREFLKTQRALLGALGRTSHSYAQVVKLAAVADGLPSYSSSFKKAFPTTSGGTVATAAVLSTRKPGVSSQSSAPLATKGATGGLDVDAQKWISSASSWQLANPESTKASWFRPDGPKPAVSLRCFNCGNVGNHYSRSCSNPRKSPTAVKLAALALHAAKSSSPSSTSPDATSEVAADVVEESGKVVGE